MKEVGLEGLEKQYLLRERAFQTVVAFTQLSKCAVSLEYSSGKEVFATNGVDMWSEEKFGEEVQCLLHRIGQDRACPAGSGSWSRLRTCSCNCLYCFSGKLTTLQLSPLFTFLLH